ncbi:hypothetical protein [Lewinella sp. IMCC34183]|uniref:hypothetical protein n=1 Tax=Lewinella sp. IMCC34183 TaxID=2248762 RepID=UPI0013005C56|nr:hypothetical protein [Lewinella sp. IMCC34183]
MARPAATVHTFRLIDRSCIRYDLPERSPLLEVRLLGFLRGDAYVNPLHDLLYALSRTSLPHVPGYRGGRIGTVTFDARGITVQEGKEPAPLFAYDTLVQLHLDYQTLPGPGSPYARNRVNPYYLHLYLSEPERVLEFDVAASRKSVTRLLQFLYDHRVRFREFRDGLRSYLLETDIRYQQVQELKARYGLDW